MTAETIEGKGWAQAKIEKGEGAFVLEAVPIQHPGPEVCKETLEDGTLGPDTLMEVTVVGYTEDSLAGGILLLACLQHLTPLGNDDRLELANKLPRLASLGVELSQGNAAGAWDWSQNTIHDLQHEDGPEEHPTYQREGQLEISARREIEAKRTNHIMKGSALKETVVMVNRERKGEKIMVKGSSLQEVGDTISSTLAGRQVLEKGEKKQIGTVTISLERLSCHEAWMEGDTGTLTTMVVRKDWWESVRGRKGEAEKSKVEKATGWKIQAYDGHRSADRECNESAGTTDEEKLDFYKPRRRPTPEENMEALKESTAQHGSLLGHHVRTDGEKGKAWRVLGTRFNIKPPGWKMKAGHCRKQDCCLRQNCESLGIKNWWKISCCNVRSRSGR